MKFARLILVSLALAATPAAFAQITVLGSGLGKDCYDAVRFPTSNDHIAEKTCTKALSHGNMNLSNRAATYVNRGIARMRSGDYDGALRDYAASERLKADNGPLYLNRGAALIYKKDFAAALTELDRAIALDTKDLFAAYYNRGIAKERTGDVPGAYFDFQKALELKPDFEQAKWQLSRFTVEGN